MSDHTNRQPPNPGFEQRVREIFSQAAFVSELGITPAEIGPGLCESTLAIRPTHLQQDGFVHAGVQATIADHTAGAAAATLVDAGETVLSVEFKINMLRPAVGQLLRCKAAVLKPGRTLIVVEAEVFAIDGERSKLTSKATVTLAVVRIPQR